MQPMTDGEVRAFMRTGSRTGKLATVRADGRPHIAPVWFEFDDATGEAVFLTGVGSVKGRNLARDPRMSICVDEMEFPFAFARLDGEARLITGAPDLAHWATETCRRYVGDDRADEFGQRNTTADEALVRVTITKLVGATGVSD